MQIERQHPVGAGDADHVGHQAGRDRHARLVLLVGAAIAEVGNDGGDPAGRGALEGVDHDQQFHDRVVDRRGKRLHDEDIVLAHALADADEGVVVAELEDFGAARRDADVVADLLRQVGFELPPKIVSWSYSPAIGVDDPFQRQAFQRIAGRFLFGGALVRRRHPMPSGCPRSTASTTKYAVVGRAGCFDSAIAGCHAVAFLDQLLQAPLVVGRLAAPR